MTPGGVSAGRSKSSMSIGACRRSVGPVLGALLLTALTNGLTLLGVSDNNQPLAVGIVVVLAALLSRFQK